MESRFIWEHNGYMIRLAQKEDAENYYVQNYCPLDKEVVRLTGSKEVLTREEVVSFFLKSVDDKDRAFFLMIAPDGRIIGESIINEITRNFAFEHLKLERLELSVFSFNPRAEKEWREMKDI